MPPLGPNLHGRKGPDGEEAGRGQAAAQQLHISLKNLGRGHRLRGRTVTMAGLVLCPASSNWMVLLVLLLSGTGPCEARWLRSVSLALSLLSLLPPTAQPLLSASL